MAVSHGEKLLGLCCGAAAVAVTVTPDFRSWWIAAPLWVASVVFGWRYLFERGPAVVTVPRVVFDSVRHADVSFGETRAIRLDVWEVWFRNRPEHPENRSIAQEMTAEVVFCDGEWNDVLRFVGQWAQSAMPEHVGWTELRDRIDLPPINVWGKLLVLGNEHSVMTTSHWSDADSAGERTLERSEYRPVFALAGEMLHAGGTPNIRYWLRANVSRVRVTLTAVNMPERIFQFAIERDAQEAVIGLTQI